MWSAWREPSAVCLRCQCGATSQDHGQAIANLRGLYWRSQDWRPGREGLRQGSVGHIPVSRSQTGDLSCAVWLSLCRRTYHTSPTPVPCLQSQVQLLQ